MVGAPTIAAASARFPRKGLRATLTVAFTVGSVASARAPTFATVVAARFLAWLHHGAYFGVAALVAAIVFALTTAFILAVMPKQPGDPHATVRPELRAFKRPAVWYALLTGSLGFGGFFAVYSSVAPLSTEVTGTSSGFVPIVLVVLGVGTTVGILAGGRLADRGAVRAIFILFGAFSASLLLLALTAHSVVGLLVGVFAVGASAQALAPAIQTRLMDVAGESQTIAAAVNHSALNIGNSLGAALGGVVIASGLGYIAPTWVGLALCVPGVVFALAGWSVTRHHTGFTPVGAKTNASV